MNGMHIFCRVFRLSPLAVMAVASTNLADILIGIPIWAPAAAFVAMIATIVLCWRHEFRHECQSACTVRQPVDGPTIHGLTIGARWHRLSRAADIAGWVTGAVTAVAFIAAAFTDVGSETGRAALQLWLFLLGIRLFADHRHTRSWCPICWRRGGWDDDHDRVPDPDPSTAVHLH